ncbi:hypothetical protein TNCV_1183041 [Trichonephila clavipes]|nr:hypothetical protein TNCV_1183041 [Trichonephila clavipes]
MFPVFGKKAVLEWCMKEALIGSSYGCPKCGKSMELRERTDSLIPSTSNAMAQMSFPRGLFRKDMVSEARSSSGISETAITLGYHLARNLNRESPPRTHSRSTSSRDSRTCSRHHRSRSPNRQTEEIEVKDERIDVIVLPIKSDQGSKHRSYLRRY